MALYFDEGRIIGTMQITSRPYRDLFLVDGHLGLFVSNAAAKSWYKLTWLGWKLYKQYSAITA